jgi:hypothetical protein
MKRKDYREKLSDLLRNDLSPADKEEIIAALTEAGMTREEIESIRSVNQMIDDLPISEPSEKMDKRFYAMVEDEQRKALLGAQDIKRRAPWADLLIRPGLRIAAGISLFLLGWFASDWLGPIPGKSSQLANLTGEVRELKETLVMTMMQQSSPVERIKAVNMITEFGSANNQIIESLLRILNNDSNDNVRLLALETLIRYSANPGVREGLVTAIANQTSPMVQLRLAEIMVALNEKRSVPEFQKVLQNTNLNYNVRGKMNETIDVLL